MAEFSFEELNSSRNKQSEQQKAKVGYFSLKDDGDEAIVRFAYSSAKEFNLVTVHTVQIDGKYRDISCLNNGCPLCEALENKSKKFYVKLVEYVRDENGVIMAQPKVWRRPAGFAYELNSWLAEYGDLRNYIFKIRRRGAKGDLKTTYDIIPANTAIYKDELYVKDFSGFDNFDLARHSYMNKTKEEIDSFIKTGSFPQVEYTRTQTVNPSSYEESPTVYQPQQRQFDFTPATAQQTTTQQTTVEQDTQEYQKPRRTYTF